MSYYILQNEETKGPYTIGQMRSMWSSGVLTLETLFCQEGYEQWLPLDHLVGELEPRSVASTSVAEDASTEPVNQPANKRVQTIEATGKIWKAAQLIFALVAIVGGYELFRSPSLGLLMIVGGVFMFCIARIGAWWCHG